MGSKSALGALLLAIGIVLLVPSVFFLAWFGGWGVDLPWYATVTVLSSFALLILGIFLMITAGAVNVESQVQKAQSHLEKKQYLIAAHRFRDAAEGCQKQDLVEEATEYFKKAVEAYLLSGNYSALEFCIKNHIKKLVKEQSDQIEIIGETINELEEVGKRRKAESLRKFLSKIKMSR
jgi:hypothetical protein